MKGTSSRSSSFQPGPSKCHHSLGSGSNPSLAMRLRLGLTLVANKTLQIPRSEFIATIRVGQGFDVVDAAIVELVEPGDLVITADIPLAALVIEKDAHGLDGAAWGAGGARDAANGAVPKQRLPGRDGLTRGWSRIIRAKQAPGSGDTRWRAKTRSLCIRKNESCYLSMKKEPERP